MRPEIVRKESKMLPPGWVYIETQWVDTIMGAYHDTLSGAFLEFEIGLLGLLSPSVKATIAEKEGECQGWPYRIAIIKESPTSIAKNGDLLMVSFMVDDPIWQTWNFSALVDTNFKHQRVMDFIFGDNQTWRGVIRKKRGWSKRVSRKQVLALEDRIEWLKVQDILGVPWNCRAWQNGFKVAYECDSASPDNDHDTFDAWLLFDQGHYFVGAKFEKAGVQD